MGRFYIFPIFIATFASRRVTLIATHSKSQKQTRLPIHYLYFILPFKPLINKEVIKVFQNYIIIVESISPESTQTPARFFISSYVPFPILHKPHSISSASLPLYPKAHSLSFIPFPFRRKPHTISSVLLSFCRKPHPLPSATYHNFHITHPHKKLSHPFFRCKFPSFSPPLHHSQKKQGML